MIELSENFTGLSEYCNVYDLLHLVKRFGKSLGFTNTNITHLEYLLNHTKKCDWLGNSNPIVFKSVSSMAIDLRITERQVNEREKQLHKVGALCWKDSGNHKRGGFRGPNGHIVYAYGIDLSPLAALYPKLLEQKELAEKYKKDWISSKRVVSFYRRKIAAIQTELATDKDITSILALAATALTKRIRASTSLDTLNSYKQKLIALFRKLEAKVCDVDEDKNIEMSGETSPKGEENFKHIYSTSYDISSKDELSSKPKLSTQKLERLEKLFLFSGKKCEYASSPKTISSVISDATGIVRSEIDTGLSYIGLGNALAALSERFKPYLHASSPDKNSWTGLVEAADYMSFDLRIPKQLWAESCSLIGRNATAICIIILDQNMHHPTNPVRSPAAVMRGMLTKARSNELHLHRSLFGILDRLNEGKVS